MLTEQSVEQTSSLSESTAHVVEGQSASAQPETAGETQTGDAVGDAGSTAAVAHPDPLAPVRMWMGTNIRRVAHTVPLTPMRDVNLKMENRDRLYVGAGYNIGIGRRWPSVRCLPDTCLF